MLKTPVLKQSHIDDFGRDGFVILRKAFDPGDVSRIENSLDELTDLPETPGKHWVYWENSLKTPGDKIVSRVENISPFVSGFRNLSDTLRAPVAQLLGEEAVLFKEKVNFKYPGADGFKPHQDQQAGWWEYADFFISVMVCIDEATEENGCLQMVAGHHQNGLIREWEPLTDEDTAEMDFVFAPSQPGDVVFFDSYAPHGSEPNMSDSTRRLYFATFNRASDGDFLERYYADKRKSYPPDIERQAGQEYIFKV